MNNGFIDAKDIVPGLFFLFILVGFAWIIFLIVRKIAKNRRNISHFQNSVKIGVSVNSLVEAAIEYGAEAISLVSDEKMTDFKMPDNFLKLYLALETQASGKLIVEFPIWSVRYFIFTIGFEKNRIMQINSQDIVIESGVRIHAD